MTLLRFALAALCCSAPLVLLHCAAPPSAGRDAEVRQLLDRWTRAWNSYDLAEVDLLFVPDDTVTYFSSEKDGLIRGIEALRDHHAGFGFVAGGKEQPNTLRLEDVRVDWHGDSALVLARWLFERPGGQPPQRGPVTFAFVPTPGGYRIAHAHFANAPAPGAAATPVTSGSRPASLVVQANIVWLYYRDVPAAQRFYEDTIGLALVVDQGFAKVYQVSPTSFVGLVDEKQGLHRASETKAVTVSFVTEQIDEWYKYLQSKGVRIRNPLGDATRHPTRGFVALDPEGYFLEFERFLDHEQNTKLLATLKQPAS